MIGGGILCFGSEDDGESNVDSLDFFLFSGATSFGIGLQKVESWTGLGIIS